MDALRATVARVQSTVLDHGFYIFYRNDVGLSAMPRQTAHYHKGNHVRSPLSKQPRNQHFLLEGAGGGKCVRHLDQSIVGQQQSAENS